MLSFLVSILLFVVVPLFCAVYVWVEFFSSPEDHAFRARFLGQTRVMRRVLPEARPVSVAARQQDDVPAPVAPQAAPVSNRTQEEQGRRLNELDDIVTGVSYRVDDLDTKVTDVDQRSRSMQMEINKYSQRQEHQEQRIAALSEHGVSKPQQDPAEFESLAEMEERMNDVMRITEERIANTNIVAQRVDDVMMAQRDMEGRIEAIGTGPSAAPASSEDLEHEVRELSGFVRDLQGQMDQVIQRFDQGESDEQDGAPVADQVGSIQHALGDVEFRLANCEAQGNQFDSVLRETRSIVDEMHPMMKLIAERLDEAASAPSPSKTTSRSSKKKTTARKVTGNKKAATSKSATSSKTSRKESSSRKSAAKKSRSRRRDDLTQIKGIGPAVAETLNSLGIRNFEHLAELTTDDIEQITEKVGGLGRKIRKQRWVQQASKLVKG